MGSDFQMLPGIQDDTYRFKCGHVCLLLCITLSLYVTPISTAVCGAPPYVPHATYCCGSFLWMIGSFVDYTCDPGYYISSGGTRVYCLVLGVWPGLLPVCSPVSCGVPEAVPNATFTPNSHLVYTQVVVYTCDTGYTNTAGHLSRTCQFNAVFSGQLPTCSAICGVPEAVPNAKHSPTFSLFHQQTVGYTCEAGYERTAGNLSRTCQANMAFDGNLPTCTAVVCGAPIAAPNASHTPTSSLIYQQTVNYTCDIGYEATDGDIIRTCQANKTFSGNLPTCSVIDCGKPEKVAHAKQSGEIYQYGAKVNYTCEEGYSMTSGDSERICQADKTYSGRPPQCSLNRFNKKTVIGGDVLKSSGPNITWWEHDLGKVLNIGRVDIYWIQDCNNSGVLELSIHFMPLNTWTDLDKLNTSELLFQTMIGSNQHSIPVTPVESQYIYVKVDSLNHTGSVQHCLSDITIFGYDEGHKMFKQLRNHRAESKEISNMASKSTAKWEPQGKQACSLQCAADRMCLGFNYSPLLDVCELLLNEIPDSYPADNWFYYAWIDWYN